MNVAEQTFDMGDLLLLLGKRLHLVHLVLALRPDVCRVVASVVDELLLHGQVHHVGADLVHEVGRVAMIVSTGITRDATSLRSENLVTVKPRLAEAAIL